MARRDPPLGLPTIVQSGWTSMSYVPPPREVTALTSAKVGTAIVLEGSAGSGAELGRLLRRGVVRCVARGPVQRPAHGLEDGQALADQPGGHLPDAVGAVEHGDVRPGQA